MNNFIETKILDPFTGTQYLRNSLQFLNYRTHLLEKYRNGEYRKNDYFRSKSWKTVSKVKLSDPAYLDRRISSCRKEIKRREAYLIYYEGILQEIENNGGKKKEYAGRYITYLEICSWLIRELQIITQVMSKQSYLQDCLDKTNAKPP